MTYIVKLYSKSYDMLGVVPFDNKTETFLHIGEIITRSKVPLEVKAEKLYSIKDGVEVLTIIVYHLHECD